MAYNHDRQRSRVTFDDAHPLAGLTVTLWTPDVRAYIAMDSLTVGGQSPANIATLAKAIGPLLIAWDLTQNGQEIEPSEAGLLSLDVRLAGVLLSELLGAIGRVPAPLGAPSTDGDSTAEGSIPMEPLSGSQPS